MNRSTNIVRPVLSGFALALACSCSGFMDMICSDRHIMVKATQSGAGKTKAADNGTTLRTYSLGEGLVLEECVSDGCFEEEVSTKGAIVTTANINQTGRSFSIEGWLGSDIATAKDSDSTDVAQRHFLSDTPVYDGSSWNLLSEHFWRNGISSTFWSWYAPSSGPQPVFTWPGSTPTDAELQKIKFTYTLPSPSSGPTYDDALRSNDILVAYNRETRSVNKAGEVSVTYGTGTPAAKNCINVDFHHPLSAIKFMIGNISGDDGINDNEYVNITDVELIDVKTGGTFTAEGSGADGCTIACTATTGKATYRQTASRSHIEDGLFTGANSSYVFFMIPQNVDDVTVRLTMTRRKKTITYESDGRTVHSTEYSDDHSITFTREVSLSGNWLPGKYYTYKINSNVYFGGEEVTLDPEKLEVSSESIEVDEDGNMTFNVSGSVDFKEWVAPLMTKGVNVLKLTFTHSYKNQQKSVRTIWLENAQINPDYTGPGDTVHDHFINPSGLDTRDATLVAAAKALPNASTYWPVSGGQVHYTGILGEAPLSGFKYIATAYDNGMNDSGQFADKVSTMYFYLGGQFDYVKIHFDYGGSTGGGSINWTAKVPIFNITEVVE